MIRNYRMNREKNKVEMEGMNRKVLITLPAMNR